MNNLSFKLDWVEIQNFRGVRDVLRIPLNAPLTIIHAANGTGKSTVCYALEWLLTNKVNDLPNTSDFSCQWGTKPTTVRAGCEINGEAYYLERINDKAYIKKIGDPKKRFIRDSELLGLLTPSSVSAGSPQATTRVRREWLRNCRWLYANSLALLVDNSKSSVRQQIFADILGLGHLASTLSNLKEYRGELPKTQGLETKLKGLLSEIQELEDRLSQDKQGREQVAHRLALVVTGFPDVSLTGNLLDDFKIAQTQVKRLSNSSNERQLTLGLMLEGWSEYESAIQQMTINRDLLKKITDDTSALQEEHRAQAEQLSALDTRIGQAKVGLEWARKNSEVLNLWSRIFEPVLNRQFSQPELSFEYLQQHFAEYSWDAARQQEWLNAIEYLISQKAIMLDCLERREKLLANPVLPPANFAQVSKSTDDAKLARVKAESEFSAISGLLDRLKSLGREASGSLTTGHCPLCSHDWKSVDTLRDQLTYSAISPEIQAAQSKLDGALASEKLWNSAYQAALERQTSAESYSAQLKSISDKLKAIDSKTKFLSVMQKSDFAKTDLDNFEFLQTRIKIAIDIRKIADTLPGIDQFLNLPPVPNANARVLSAKQALTRYIDHYDEQVKLDQAARPRLEQSVTEKLQTIEAKTRESRQISLSVASVGQITSRFQSQWLEVGEDRPLSRESHAVIQAGVTEDLDRLKIYESEINECNLILSVDDDSERLRNALAEKQAVEQKLAVGQSRIAAADRTLAEYGDHVREATIASLSPLLEPATELFSRMHANEVYKKLSVSGDDLNWTVIAEGHDTPLDAEEKLSQGQRQDLALSLYLARAKATGGSFLLDEPIAHLDDLNKVAMLDIFRLVATSMPEMKVILTTASDSLARHLTQKFSGLPDQHLLNTVYLEGNPRTGVTARVTTNVTIPSI